MISYAVWAYHRFALSLRDVEDLMAERGVIVSYESIRVWCQRFGTQIEAKICGDRPVPADKWHLDEVLISIRGRKHWLWRAVDANGDVLEILMQSRRNAHAAKLYQDTKQQSKSMTKPVPSDAAPEAAHQTIEELGCDADLYALLPRAGNLAV